jgi:hypothetical protein
LVGAALRPLYGALKTRCAASYRDGATSDAERMRSATNYSGWLTVTESHRDPTREAGREAGSSLCLGPLPCLPALSCA